MIRSACVSGMFYEGDGTLLRRRLDTIFEKTGTDEYKPDNTIKACVVPHAGYVYSGLTAGYAFNELMLNESADTVVVIGPNHTGMGGRLSLSSADSWETPLGLVDVDVEFMRELESFDHNACFDDIAHLREHSIEVELPFLQYISEKFNRDYRIVPVVMGYQELELAKNLAVSIRSVEEKLGRNCVVVASSDLTHYEDADTAKYLDEKILKSVEDMDIDSLINNIVEYDITMCGYGPVITAIQYSKLLDNHTSHVLNYSHSGMVSGDYDSVVGYTSAIIKK